jgi:choline-glycine betaine transporter
MVAVDPSGTLSTLLALKEIVSMYTTWLVQGLKALMFFFVLFIVFKYGHLHLGRPNEKAEYSNLSYFSMIVAGGMGPALLLNSVSEPLSHRQGNFYANAGYRSQDEVDMFAINLTVSNWGMMSWTHMTIIALCTALACHRFNLPKTIRSTLYPILGAYTWGWMGDVIDGQTIVVTLAGECYMSCVIAFQAVANLSYLGWIDPKSTNADIISLQCTVVWIIAAFSAGSVVSGLKGAIQFMARLGFAVGALLLSLVFVMEDTKFLLNLQVQEVGYYLQTSLFQLNFLTDAFGQLRKGSGRAIDGKAATFGWIHDGILFYQVFL